MLVSFWDFSQEIPKNIDLNHFFAVPTGILTKEEQLDIMLLIGGETPIGTPICASILPRRGMSP